MMMTLILTLISGNNEIFMLLIEFFSRRQRAEKASLADAGVENATVSSAQVENNIHPPRPDQVEI